MLMTLPSSASEHISAGSTGQMLFVSQEFRGLKESFADAAGMTGGDLLDDELNPVLGMDAGEREPLV